MIFLGKLDSVGEINPTEEENLVGDPTEEMSPAEEENSIGDFTVLEK